MVGITEAKTGKRRAQSRKQLDEPPRRQRFRSQIVGLAGCRCRPARPPTSGSGFPTSFGRSVDARALAALFEISRSERSALEAETDAPVTRQIVRLLLRSVESEVFRRRRRRETCFPRRIAFCGATPLKQPIRLKLHSKTLQSDAQLDEH